MQKWNPTSCLFGTRFACAQTAIFSAEPCMYQKCGRVFRLQFVSKESRHPALQTKIEQHFGGFFHQIKVRQPIGRQNSMQTMIHLALCLSLLMEAGTGRGCDGMGEFMCMIICVTT
jgi:hypothetical protein